MATVVDSSVVRSVSPRARALVTLRKWLDDGVLVPGDPVPPERELSRKLGVSLSTLHRATKALEIEGRLMVLGGKTRVVAERPEGQAKLLRNTIAVVAASRGPSPEHRHPGWLEYVAVGAFDAIEAAGFHALRFHSRPQADRDFADLMSAKPLGVIIPELSGPDTPAHLIVAQLEAAGIPTCVYGDAPEVSNCDRVISDHADGAAQATSWMIARGRKRILQVLPRQDDYWVHLRRQGYEQAMGEAGLKPLAALMQMGVHQFESWQAHTRESFEAKAAYDLGCLLPHLTGKNPVDAILLPSDGQVPTAAAACRQVGKQPNGDVLLAGYDNYWTDIWERQFEPTHPMISVNRNNPLIGQELMKLLLDRIEGRLAAPPQRRLVKPQLVVMDERASEPGGHNGFHKTITTTPGISKS